MLKSMYKVLYLLAVVLISHVYAAEDIYMTVDENGNPVFTDQPSDDAKKIEVKDITTIPALKDPGTYTSPKEPVERYRQLSILNPKNDETYFRSEGDLTINVAVLPRIRGSDQLVYYVDGKEVSSGRSPSFSIAELDRGTHSVYVAIVDGKGEVIKTSETVIFHLRQTSRLNTPAP
jgi:hypothetical protein